MWEINRTDKNSLKLIETDLNIQNHVRSYNIVYAEFTKNILDCLSSILSKYRKIIPDKDIFMPRAVTDTPRYRSKH